MRKACPKCGSEGTADFCTRCGASMKGEDFCGSCGASCEPGALYCGSCGSPQGSPPAKGMRDRLPWILSGLALVAFAVAISLMIGGATGERAPGMPPTGGIIEGTPATGGSNPGAVDLASMTPRAAADRLFDRAMREDSGGDQERARFFADMAIQSYGSVPPAEMDNDARFHLGLLSLLLDAPDDAAGHAAAIFAVAPDHLLGWVLQEQVAERLGDDAGVAEARSRFLSVLDAQRALNLDEYMQHQGIIDEQAARLAGGG